MLIIHLVDSWPLANYSDRSGVMRYKAALRRDPPNCALPHKPRKHRCATFSESLHRSLADNGKGNSPLGRDAAKSSVFRSTKWNGKSLRSTAGKNQHFHECRHGFWLLSDLQIFSVAVTNIRAELYTFLPVPRFLVRIEGSFEAVCTSPAVDTFITKPI